MQVLDFDTHIGFWVEGIPYLWIPGTNNIQESKRIYTATIPDGVAIFDKYNKPISHNPNIVPSSFLNETNAYSILPLGKRGCDFVRNCFLVNADVSLHNYYSIKVEGKSLKDYKDANGNNSVTYAFPTTITVIDPTTGFRDEVELKKYDQHNTIPRLSPNFLPTKVIYNKDSHTIAQKITRDRRKGLNTKDILRVFYKKNIAEETWSTNKTTNSKYYEWFTKYTSVYSHPSYIDIGCGSGKDASLISKEINANTVMCADVKDSRVSDAKSLTFLHIDISTPLKLEDNSVNIITLFHTIHHMEDAEFRLKDIYRLLSNGGLLIIKDHNVETQETSDNVTFEHFVYSIGEGEATVDDEDTYKDILPMYYYSAKNIETYLESIGFEKLYLHTYTNPTRTYNAVFKKH